MSSQQQSDSNIDEVKTRVLSSLTTDLPACDCLVTLFHAALASYRHDTVLKPYPQEFVLKDGNKDIDGLRSTMNGLPSLGRLTKDVSSIDNRLLHLLDWVVHNKNFTLCSKPANKFPEIEQATNSSTHTAKPCAIFELCYSSEQETKWEEVTQGHGSFLAYHGSRVENFHCISHIGLLSHMNKTGLYGEGTYLSTELSVCMNFSPSGNVWGHSQLPSLCSMVAVCEVVNNPEIRSRVQVGGEPSFNQKIPERYFVVTNDELIRLKYILVFAQQTTTIRPHTHHWIYIHKWTIIIILYIVFLLFIGLCNSRYVTNLYNHYTRKHITL